MASVTDAPLERLLREVDPETAAAFVADLFEARGYAVDRVGAQRIAAESDGETMTIAVHHPEGEPIAGGSDIDRVVAIDGAGWGGDADPMTVAALQRQLAYAVDRPVASALLETHFDWTPADGLPAGTDTDSASGVKAGLRQPGDQGRALAVVVLLVALLAGSAVALTSTGGGIGSATDGPDGTTGDAAATPGSNADAEPTATATATPVGTAESDGGTGDSSEPERYDDAPPGIVGPNKVNIYDAAGAFWDELDGESYQLSIAYREYATGYLVGAYLETLRVESNERYAVDVSRVGGTETRPLTIGKVDQYANGSVRYLRYGNGTVTAEPTAPYDRFMVNATQYLAWFLSSENSSIDSRETRGNTTIYRVRTEGDLDPRFDDARGTLYTTGDGLVRYARWEYRPADHPDLRVVFEMRVTDVGSTRVTAPDWVGNETVRTVGETAGTANGTAGAGNETDTQQR